MISRRKLLVLVIDLAVLVAAALGTSLLYSVSFERVVVMALIGFPLPFYLAGLYEQGSRKMSTMLIARIVVVMVLSVFAVSFAGFMYPFARISRSVLLTLQLAVVATLPIWGPLVDRLLWNGQSRRRVAVVGGGWAGGALVEALRHNTEYSVVGVYDDDERKRGQALAGIRIQTPTRHVLANGEAETAQVVAVAITNEKSPELLRTLVDCRRRGIQVMDMPTAYEAATARLPVEHLSDAWVAFWSHLYPTRTGIKGKIKRLLDLAGAIVLLACFAPVVLVAMLAIRLDSPGPILYRQRRVGHDGKEFELYKLRTMRTDAESGSGAVWATEDDPRVTGVGKFLRRSRLDEVPQLWNVLRGEMSLVGPRPERPEFVQLLTARIPHYDLRHFVKPGVTGWAQIRYPYGASVEDARAKLEYDLYYIRHVGIIFDLRIVLKTIHVLLFARGGR